MNLDFEISKLIMFGTLIRANADIADWKPYTDHIETALSMWKFCYCKLCPPYKGEGGTY